MTPLQRVALLHRPYLALVRDAERRSGQLGEEGARDTFEALRLLSAAMVQASRAVR